MKQLQQGSCRFINKLYLSVVFSSLTRSHSPSALLMTSRCFWLSCLTLTVCLSVVLLSLPKCLWSFSRLRQRYLDGTQQLCSACRGISSRSQHQVTDAIKLNDAEIFCTCVSVPAAAAAALSSSCRLLLLLFIVFTPSDDSPSVLSCKQENKHTKLVESEQ